MDQNNKINELIQSAGVLAELCRIQYDAFINVNFTKTQALDLTKETIKAAYLLNKSKNEGAD